MPQKHFLSILKNKRKLKTSLFYDDNEKERHDFFRILKKMIDEVYHESKKPDNLVYDRQQTKWYNLIYTAFGAAEKVEDVDTIINPCKKFLLNGRIMTSDGDGVIEIAQKRFAELCVARERENTDKIFNNISAVEMEQLCALISFASQVSPLHPIGFFLLQSDLLARIAYEKENMILTKGVSANYAFSQECLFRVLKAIGEKRVLKINEENETYIPLKIVFEQKSPLYAETPYFYAKKEKSNEIKKFDMSQNDIVVVGSVVSNKEALPFDFCEKEEKITYIVEFLIDAEKTAYLENIIERHPAAVPFCQRSGPKDILFIESPYHEEKLKVLRQEYKFEIQKQNSKNFEEWVRGFGDFAKMKSKHLYHPEKKSLADKEKENNLNDLEFQHALCQPYNSKFLRSSLELKGDIKPTNLELFWLGFILEQYPNLTCFFLNSESLHKIEHALKIFNGNNSFDFNPFSELKRFSPPIYDIDMEPFRFLKKAIKNRLIVSYTRKVFIEKTDTFLEDDEKIMPYAFSYNAIDHVSYVMAYSLKEQRLISIPVTRNKRNEIRTGSENEESLKSMSEDEKLYFCIVRYNALRRKGKFVNQGKDKDKIIKVRQKNILQIFSSKERFFFRTEGHEIKQKNMFMWVNSNSKSSDFSSCAERFIYYFDKLKKLLEDNIETENVVNTFSFIHSVFSFYFEMLENNQEKYIRQSRMEGIHPFSLEELKHKTNILFLLFVSFYQKFKEVIPWNTWMNDIVKLVANEEPDYGRIIDDEIRYLIEECKKFEVEFKVKPSVGLCDEVFDRIYDIFAAYNCSRKKDLFVVSFERFDFRKIHQRLLALSDIIVVTAPKETVNIINKRLRNVEKLKKL